MRLNISILQYHIQTTILNINNLPHLTQTPAISWCLLRQPPLNHFAKLTHTCPFFEILIPFYSNTGGSIVPIVIG